MINWFHKFNSVLLPSILLVNFIFILYKIRRNRYIDGNIVFEGIVAIICTGCVFALYTASEQKRIMQEQEIRMYELYNQSFVNIIQVIRMKQHEFDNHITALRNMQYMYTDQDEYRRIQNDYCEKLLSDNKLNKLLKINMHPIIVQAVYTKLVYAQENDIEIEYEVEDVLLPNSISIPDLLEMINILLDNAIEYLMTKKQDKILMFKLSINTEGKLVIEVKNTCVGITYSEIQLFFNEGYSTKGEKRGIGLTRLKYLCERHNVSLVVQLEEENKTWIGIYLTV